MYIYIYIYIYNDALIGPMTRRSLYVGFRDWLAAVQFPPQLCSDLIIL